MGLTSDQQLAVENRGGTLLVSAAAGSGKTRVLVERLLSYLLDHRDPANIDDFLMITYTKAAAAELRGKIADRLTKALAEDPDNRHLQRQTQRLYMAKISTVHGFCSDILREYVYRLDLPSDFRIAEENECREIRERVLDQLLEDAYEHIGEEEAFRTLVDTQGLGRTDALVPQIIEQVYDKAQCHPEPEVWLDACLAQCEEKDRPEDTVWGKFLLDEARYWLDRELEALERCAKEAAAVDGWEKVTTLLNATVLSLRQVRDCPDWDGFAQGIADLNYGRLTFPKKGGDPDLAESIKAIRTACKEKTEALTKLFSDSGETVLAGLSQTALAAKGLTDLVRQFGKNYAQAKKRRRIVDFGDLEHYALELLLGKNHSGPTAAAREIGSRFREILVDEYQDSNAVQDAIFAALTGQRHNLFLVGDVKQSIYQFRLADPGIFLEKYRSFGFPAEAAPGQGRKILLSSNFRSGGGVLDAANHVFRSCMSVRVGDLDYGDREALIEGTPHIPLGEPETELDVIAVRENAYPEEADFVAARIAELLDGKHMVRDKDGEQEILRPIRPEDIMILLRSPGSTGSYFQRALAKRGIPCGSGGGGDLLQTQEVETLVALLQVVNNPRQDIPLLSVLASPLFLFTAEDLANLRSGCKDGQIYDAILQDESEKSAIFRETLSRLRAVERAEGLEKLLETILLSTRMEALYAAMEEGQARRERLTAFCEYAMNYAAGGQRDLDQFLDHLDSLREKGLLAGGENKPSGVGIMSIHSSKGLEFPVVILAGLARQFNMENIRSQVVCHQSLGLGLNCADAARRVRYPALSKLAICEKLKQESLSEEMRVLYVAMTRPKDRLIMTYAAGKPEKKIAELTARMDLSSRELLTAEASCPGDWVLLAALKRTEAGELFAVGGRPRETQVSDRPWKIRLTEAPVVGSLSAGTEKQAEHPDLNTEKLAKDLAFRYDHAAATETPGKLTATQLKGRDKDQETAENAENPEKHLRIWRKACFRGEKRRSGTDYGSAMHAAMQYIDYQRCGSREEVDREIQRLVSQRFLTEEQGSMVNTDQIAAFFASPLGQRLRNGENVIREFKFSLLTDAAPYGDGLAGEQMLLQGVVDCALVEPEGITVVDFKTDHVSPEGLPEAVERYRGQVQAYAGALERIYERPVKKALLYFFHAGTFCEVL